MACSSAPPRRRDPAGALKRSTNSDIRSGSGGLLSASLSRYGDGQHSATGAGTPRPSAATRLAGARPSLATGTDSCSTIVGANLHQVWTELVRTRTYETNTGLLVSGNYSCNRQEFAFWKQHIGIGTEELQSFYDTIVRALVQERGEALLSKVLHVDDFAFKTVHRPAARQRSIGRGSDRSAVSQPLTSPR
ncbi:BZ3500_MvSof-1268-A1-R1_Chr4-3g07357 [Microbotryum saponariae]|uniref:BZ3500_MvSof-1268-A1-R1_Chr4-3g07357 protein n=1 Tax=Microbotryum saponariae TaxID=289078 RepID=A0A2X0LNQ8_9BASI|nr:BZ3500_MvSof-1268-A1-R1_Chr4-3g07357 [Microbotryum saponariae]SDA07020.1 BZ3501_MvSof-1269-A2-R1_Chr4-2g07066 [Microbotryum saponariae]